MQTPADRIVIASHAAAKMARIAFVRPVLIAVVVVNPPAVQEIRMIVRAARLAYAEMIAVHATTVRAHTAPVIATINLMDLTNVIVRVVVVVPVDVIAHARPAATVVETMDRTAPPETVIATNVLVDPVIVTSNQNATVI